MSMAELKQTFGGVRNMVILSASKVDAQQEYTLRKTLRGQKIKLTQVKNSLARKVLGESGINVEGVWAGPTSIAYGTESIKELSQAIDKLLKETEKKDPKFKDKITVKAAVADGLQITFAQALKMPTRQEASDDVLAAILSPAGNIAALLTGAP